MKGKEYIDDAAAFAKALALSEMRYPGDHGPAMRRLALKIGVRWTVLKNLHYRPPKEISTSDFVALGTEAGRRGLHTKGQRLEPRSSIGRILVRYADTLDRVADAMDRTETLK